MTIDLTPILQAVIGLLAALITAKLIPWIKANTTGQQRAILEAATRTAVYAAEQLYGAGHGADKLDFVCNYLTTKGFSVDRTQIEAAVREMGDAIASGSEGASERACSL